MSRIIVVRGIAGAVAVALALGSVAGSASARTFEFNAHGSLAQQSSPRTDPASSATSGGHIEWSYVAIGASSAALALIAGGVFATGRRRSPHTRHPGHRSPSH